MKRITLLLTVLIAITVSTQAQIPNSGFENWTNFGSYMEPNGWETTNAYSAGSFYAVTRSTDHFPAGVGSYSIRIENNIAFLGDFSGMGIIMVDTLSEPMPAFPITGHPTSLTGYYKFAPQNNDTMAIAIKLYNNGGGVSYNIFSTTIAASSWTAFTIPLSAYATADSAHIIISPWYCDGPQYVPHGNSVLYVDNLNFDNLVTSVSEAGSENPVFKLYPNPATDVVTLNTNNIDNADLTLNIYNVAGVLVKSEILEQNNQQINVGDLSNGIYMVTIKSKDFINSQKLIIQK